MLSHRNLKLDLFALVLLAGAVLLGASLFTYDATDPPSTLLHPPKTEVANACGRVGAYVAHYVIASVGFGAFYVLTSLAALGLTLLWRQEVNQPILRGVGWALSLAAASTIAAMALPTTSPGPEIGAGGYLGAMGFAVLESHFAQVGAYILALAVLVAGLLLCTDYLLFRVAAVTTTASGAGLMQVGRLGRRAATRSRGGPRERVAAGDDLSDDEADLDDEQEAEDDEGDDWEEAEYDEYDYEEDDEEELEYDEDELADDELPSPEPLKVRTPAAKAESEPDSEHAAEPAAAQADHAHGLKDRISSALRIKNPKQRRTERDDVIEQLEAADHGQVDDVDYQLPPLDLLLEAEDICYEAHEKEVRRKAKVLERTFRNFGLNVKVVEIETGPVIAQYEIELEAGLRLSKITGLADDLAIALRVPSVRIVAPIPGKNTVGIEVPNETRQLVRLREVIEETNGSAKRMKIPIYLGKDVSGNAMAVDLAALPHLLIAGRTGTGKSVCLNSIIVSMLMSRGPDEVRMLMIDPKMVELSGYKKLPHLMHPVVTDMRKAEAILAWAVDKMEERYQMLARAGVRHVSVYNQLGEEELRERMQPKSDAEWENVPKNLPFIVIVADEMADLMMTAGKEVEQHIIRLAQKSRAVGIHLILATQKPTVDVITGLIKSNLPARIAFQVASRTDSRVVLDENGADKLLGNGDMLFLSPGTSQLLRGQGTFLSDDEIAGVTEFVGTDAPQFARELIELKVTDEQETAAGPAGLKDRDELYEAAVDVVIREQRGSVSLLQRCLGIGYGRAARLIDYMAEDGIVAEYNGSKAREVLMSLSDWEAMSNNNAETPASDEPLTAATVQPRPKRPNRVTPAPWEDEEEPASSPLDPAHDPYDEPGATVGPPAAPSNSLATRSTELDDEATEACDLPDDALRGDLEDNESAEGELEDDEFAEEAPADEECAADEGAEDDDESYEEAAYEDEDELAEDDQWEYEDEEDDEEAAADAWDDDEEEWDEDSDDVDAEDDGAEEDEAEDDDDLEDEVDEEEDDDAWDDDAGNEAADADDEEEWEYEDDEDGDDAHAAGEEDWDEEEDEGHEEWDEECDETDEWEDDESAWEEDEPTVA